MPNLRQLISLKKTYGQLGFQERLAEEYIDKEVVSEMALEKGFTFSQEAMLEHFDVSNAKPALIQYFESLPTEDVVLLFIDIANFSTLMEKKDGQFLTEYLNDYYVEAIPVIYHFGGQIEKIMGDGIICVFGKPFINVDWPVEFNYAELCAKSLIEKFEGTDKQVKVAIHSGAVTYYKTPGDQYEEYTMIGKPITELFRLESVSRTNALNFYVNGVYDSMRPTTGLGLSKIKSSQVRSFKFEVKLQGVDFSEVRYLKFK